MVRAGEDGRKSLDPRQTVFAETAPICRGEPPSASPDASTRGELSVRVRPVGATQPLLLVTGQF